MAGPRHPTWHRSSEPPTVLGSSSQRTAAEASLSSLPPPPSSDPAPSPDPAPAPDPEPSPPRRSRTRRAREWFGGLSEAGKVALVTAVLTTAIGGAFGVVNTVTSGLIGGKGKEAGDGAPQTAGRAGAPSAHNPAVAGPTAPGAGASARSPECEIRSGHDLYCTGTAGITTYTQRDRASHPARPLGPETHFVAGRRDLVLGGVQDEGRALGQCPGEDGEYGSDPRHRPEAVLVACSKARPSRSTSGCAAEERTTPQGADPH
ncbi:hypothetical protein SUDANB38_01950 [Streptomyces sp. enrichment culture]